MPTELPRFELADFAEAATPTEVAEVLLEPFFAESALAPELERIVAETLRFPLPLAPLRIAGRQTWLLELFHGPTAAFKDVGAGFLAPVSAG